MSESRPFADVFDQLVRTSGLPAAEIARRLGVYSGQVSHWRRGGGVSIANVHKIADLFGVDRAQLEAAAGYPASPPTSDDSPALAALIAILRRRWDELHEPEQRAINAVVRTLAGDTLHAEPALNRPSEPTISRPTQPLKAASRAPKGRLTNAYTWARAAFSAAA